MGPADWFMQQYNSINGAPQAPSMQGSPYMMAQQQNMMRSANPGGASFQGAMPGGNPMLAQMGMRQQGMPQPGSPYGPMQGPPGQSGGLLGQGGMQNPNFPTYAGQAPNSATGLQAQMPGMNALAMQNQSLLGQQLGGPQGQSQMPGMQGGSMQNPNFAMYTGAPQMPNSAPNAQMMTPQMMMQRYNGFGFGS